MVSVTRLVQLALMNMVPPVDPGLFRFISEPLGVCPVYYKYGIRELIKFLAEDALSFWLAPFDIARRLVETIVPAVKPQMPLSTILHPYVGIFITV